MNIPTFTVSTFEYGSGSYEVPVIAIYDHVVVHPWDGQFRITEKTSGMRITDFDSCDDAIATAQRLDVLGDWGEAVHAFIDGNRSPLLALHHAACELLNKRLGTSWADRTAEYYRAGVERRRLAANEGAAA